MRSTTRSEPGKGLVPPLRNGDNLSRVEFERRYAAMPGKGKAELIDGVVYIDMGPPPVSPEHARPHSRLSGWLMVYNASTPGTDTLTDATVRLGDKNEPQPDTLLLILPEHGGRSRIDSDGYLQGGVELAVEIAVSSASYDLHQKKTAYLRHNCAEYLALVVEDAKVHWFTNKSGEYEPLSVDAKGVVRSRVFPGLWLDTRALLADDAAKLLETLRFGLASKEHAAFVKTLRAKKR